MVDQAVKAGASWEQIGAARGTRAEQARQDYRGWADAQHNLVTWTEGRIGTSDAEAIARAADPVIYPGGVGDPAAPASEPGSRLLCAHANRDGYGMHRLAPGEKCEG